MDRAAVDWQGLPLAERVRRLPPRLLDGLIAAFLLAWALPDVPWWWRPAASHVPPTPWIAGFIALALAQSVPFCWRRQRPGAVVVLVAGVLSTRVLLGQDPVSAIVALAFALYGAGAYGSRLLRRSCAWACVALVAGCYLGWRLEHGEAMALWSLVALVLGAALLAGDYARTRRVLADELRARAEHLEAERALEAARAVMEERTRIARELHDVVAHHVSAIVVVAGGARLAHPGDGGRALAALAQTEATAREALVELNRVLGALRGGEAAAPERAPQPGLARLDALADTARAAGLAVEVSVEGGTRPLPPGVDVSAYRIVQEAITNVLKHAGPARARVRVRYGPGALELSVADDGCGSVPGGGGAPGGHGLVGMRERVALFGGTLHAGPRPGGGFEVRARLPLGPAAG